MARHRYDYKYYLEGKSKKQYTSFQLFDKFGIDNCKILLIKHYPCSCLEELRQEEGRCIQYTDCVNKYIAGRTVMEYYYQNKEHCLQVRKQYRVEHSDKIKENRQIYYQENKPHFANYTREYRKIHADRLNAIVICDCGSKFQHRRRATHCKTQKHQDWLKQHEQQEQQLEELD